RHARPAEDVRVGRVPTRVLRSLQTGDPPLVPSGAVRQSHQDAGLSRAPACMITLLRYGRAGREMATQENLGGWRVLAHGTERSGRCARPWAKSRRGFRWALPEDEAPVPQPKTATWSA